MTLIVCENPYCHLWTRAIAAFVIAPYLIWLGERYDDWTLTLIGVGTLLVDMYTFGLTVRRIQLEKKISVGW